MIRAVLDTNTLASGAIASGETIGALINVWLVEDGYEVVLSPTILSELVRTLSKPYFSARLSPDDIAAYLAAVRQAPSVIQITAAVPSVVSGRADNLVLATAESGGAQYVVSGDRELQRLGSYKKISIASPRTFLDVLRGHGIC